MELCAGTSSAIKYHLQDDPNAIGLLIDLHSADFMCKHVPSHLHPCFTPISNTDVEHLTYESLSLIVHKAWGTSLEQVHVYHHSPMCQSLSGATCDCTQHFAVDKCMPITNLAQYHLRCLRSVFRIFHTLHDHNLKGIIHVP